MDSFILCVRDKNRDADEFGSRQGPIAYLNVPDDQNLPRPSHQAAGVKQWLQAVTSAAMPSGVTAGNALDIVFSCVATTRPQKKHWRGSGWLSVN